MSSSAGKAACPSVGQRILSLSAGIALNLAALAMLILLRGPSPVPGKDAGGSVISVSLGAAPRTASEWPLAVPRFRQHHLAALAIPALPAAAAVSSNGTSAECPIAEDVAKGIVADPIALDAIIHAPADLRSVADAIVVWNLAWVPATTDLQSPLGSVRTNVTATLRSVSEDCLSSVVVGPRLIAIPDGERTMILVFGSSEWSWKALIGPDPEDYLPVSGEGMAAEGATSRDLTDVFKAK